MAEEMQKRSRMLERSFLFFITGILACLFFYLFTILQKEFENVPSRVKDGSIVNLNDINAAAGFKNLLAKGYYFEDARDIDVITTSVAKGLAQSDDEIENIGELNKSKYYVDAGEAYLKGGETFRKRVSLSRSLLGFSDVDSIRYLQEKNNPPAMPAVNNINLGKYIIKGTIYSGDNKVVPGVLVRLEMNIPQDSLQHSDFSEVENSIVESTPSVYKVYATDLNDQKQLQSFIAYARTDEKGNYVFKGLPSGKSFQVIPLQPGYQFGQSKGVQELNNDASFSFIQLPHKLRLFSGKDFNILKKEGALIVRTPQEATRWYWIIVISFLLGFIILHVILSIQFSAADQLILPVVMLLTGLSLLALLSLQDPLRDRFLAKSTLWYFIMGFAGLIVMLLFNLRRFTPDSGLYRLFIFKNRLGAKGWQWGAFALALLLLTIFLGTGPEGSGVKVNLFGFQPSEVVKFLMVIFLAGFFAANEKFISGYATFRKRWNFFYIALGAIIAAILLFLVLGDLGPAIVICFTFIILFSFSRGDFINMAASVVLYVLAIWLLKNFWIATAVTIAILFAWMFFLRKKLSESSVMALVVISGFLLVDQIPFLNKLIPGPVQRLVDRKDIWQNPWDNEVFGGDQIANGIWAMSSGGVSGQGIGEGFGKTIPEAHTDMILPSIGEEFGLTGIICVFILFMVYLHRSILIGRQTGRPFLFYLCSGIGIGTFVQFILIAGGSTGALPLSGVSLPSAILLFLVLGDLGPAIVICFTFIILFSFSRGDFINMAASVVLYVLAIWLLKNFWIATAVTIAILFAWMFFLRKKLSESSVMALVVISGFLLVDQIPFLNKLIPGPVQRLVDRKDIWQNPWDNEVFGGDQIANGIWAMSSGGVSGQGIGEGFGKTIPEAHTDMILPSIGEEFGLTGIICVFILFMVYLHRSILIGRQTGRPFLFYLCSGIGIGTFVQFILIAGGSTGALPLSGVSLPFVSYGGSSLISNILAAGFLLSASTVKGSKVQMNFITSQHDKNLVPELVAAFIGIILLTVNVSRYLFNNKKWVVQPALVADRSGARMFSYNPRIAILMNRLQAGSLYDRNGNLLATSKPEMVFDQNNLLMKAGLQQDKLVSLTKKRLDRYYPFAEHMFFFTGDANTGVFMGATNGYFAEYELIAELRGFKTPTVNYNVIAHRFREDRFLPQSVKEMSVSKRDFSALSSLLIAGINSKEVDSFKLQNRDITLTVDAALQTRLQQSLQTYDSIKNKRVSIVIMEDVTGDVIASATYPLPPVTEWDKLTLTRREQNRYAGWLTLNDLGFTYATQPGSTAKVATALAAFNKLGDSAARKIILIRRHDLIRVKGLEPDEPGYINMERAIIKSNNSYFIKLANEEKLQEEMATVYIRSGMFLKGVGGYFFQNNVTNQTQEEEWRKLWRKTEFTSIKRYNKNDIRKTRAKGISGMAWGQGELIASPASVARLVAGIANRGVMIPNRFVLKIRDSSAQIEKGITITQPDYADKLSEYLKKQSAGKLNKLHLTVAGKTGTPERIFKGQRINDGWYVFYAPKINGPGNIITCVRIESTKGSGDAVTLSGDLIIPKLLEYGYIKGFPDKNAKDSVINN